MKTNTRSCIACVAALMLTFGVPALPQTSTKGGVLSAATADASQARPELIDATQRGSLTIHKSAGDPLTQFGDPHNPVAKLTRAPIPGIRFQAQRVTSVDLTTSEGWLGSEKLKPADFYRGGAREKELSTDAIVAETGADGVAHLDNLPLGLYYVTEIASTAQDKHLSIVSPFLVSVPSTDPTTRDRWLYNVEVHAKDQKLTVNKEVNRVCVDAGDSLSYSITGTSPAASSDGKIHRYTIADPLPQGVEVKKTSARVSLSDRVTGGKVTALSDADYTFSVTNQRVATMELTATGLEKLAAIRNGNPDAAVTTTYDVTTSKTTPSPIRSTAYLLTEGYPEFDTASTPGINSNTVTTTLPCSSPGGNPPNAAIPPIIPRSGDPANPAGGGNPGQPGGPAAGAENPGQRGVDKLALTGASVLWAVALGALLTISGAVLLRRRMNS